MSENIISRINALLGGRPVLLPIQCGQKGPFYESWNTLTWEQTQDPATLLEWARKNEAGERIVDRSQLYSAALAECVAKGGNIGVLLTDGLCAIDIDTDEEVEPFLRLNPRLRDTLITKGARGVQIWVRCEADPELETHGIDSYPGGCFLKSATRKWTGKKGDESNGWGEWRTRTPNGRDMQSVIWGQHPSGKRYEWISEKPAKSILFRDIAWPADLIREWDAANWLAFVTRYGPPWVTIEGSIAHPTEAFWAARMTMRHHLLYEANEERFYLYEPSTGAWRRKTEDAIKALIADEMMAVSRDPALHGLMAGPDSAAANWRQLNAAALVALQTNLFRSAGRLGSICTLLKGVVGKQDIFSVGDGIIHLKNGMLDLRDAVKSQDGKAKVRLLPFSHRYYSRNPIPVSFEPGRKCTELQSRLLTPGYTEAEIKMLQRWFGQCLLGKNRQQMLMIISGNAGAGKSTLIKLFQKFIGEDNVMELRTQFLGERFEMFFYLGKTFLSGVDVPGNFLQFNAAAALKKLTGDDLLHAEGKSVKDPVAFRGNFNIGISCNSKLKVLLKADHDAWRRRICIARCNAPKPAPKDRIEALEEYLIQKEGPGILNWGIQGALEVLAGLPIRHAEELNDVVDDLINESDSVRVFCKRNIERERGDSVTAKALYDSYLTFCETREWEALGENEFAKAVKTILAELYQASQSNSIKDESNRAVRGYRGIRLRSQPQAASAAASYSLDPDESAF